jgi:S1-C subfamily serine protease
MAIASAASRPTFFKLRHYRAFIRRSSPSQIWLENRRRDRLMAEVVRLEIDPLGEELKVSIGFAIPADTARTVIAVLKDKGVVARGWIGVQIQPVTQEVADSLGLKSAKGALVAETQPNSAASAAGVLTVNSIPLAHCRESVNASSHGRGAQTDMVCSHWARPITSFAHMGRFGSRDEIHTRMNNTPAAVSVSKV